jgi:hypothetical protein
MAQYTKTLANDFNGIQRTLANVLGTGATTKGYGSPVTSFTISTGSNISSAEFTALATDINTCYRHITNGDATTLASVVSKGKVTWANFVTYQSAVTYINNNSDTNGGTASSPSDTTTLPAGWGNASGNRIATQTGTITFASAEAMRFFFNQGNTITITGSCSYTGAEPKTVDWRDLVKTVSVSHTRSTYRVGSAADTTYYMSTNPYGYSPPAVKNDYVQVTMGAPSGNTMSITITLNDKGQDNQVASNCDADLTFTASRIVSNTTGISTYGPTVTFGTWAYTA